MLALLLLLGAFDPKPWIDDLEQARQAFATRYANLEWAQRGSATKLSELIAEARARIEAASNDGDARAAFDRLARRLGDGHVQFVWPRPKRSLGKNDPCTGYDSAFAAPPLVARARGYRALQTSQSKLFPAGVIESGRHRVGVLQIGLFGPGAAPALCREALAALGKPPQGPCDEDCQDRVEREASARYTQAFMAQLDALKKAGIDTLLIDLAGNGGGSEWAEAAARMVTATPLWPGRSGFVRGPHWVKKLGALESRLREAAREAAPEDRARLLRVADAAAAKKAVAATPCDPAPLWEGKAPDCAWLGEGLDAARLLGVADPLELRDKPWAPDLFPALEFPYRAGVWRGPLLVLVDAGTASAAEEFAEVLQDNRAALIVGAPTYGAGCGHTDGGTPTVLSHSGAVLEVPDCARFRADGSNAVRGVLPDVLVGFRKTDSLDLRAAAFLARLPAALGPRRSGRAITGWSRSPRAGGTGSDRSRSRSR